METVSGDRGLLLLSQLERILEEDALIDEVGFVHPTQLEDLNCAIESDEAPIRSRSYDETVFWIRDHKLAVSISESPLIFVAAKKLFFDAVKKCRSSLNCDSDLRNDVLRHSKCYLLLCCDSGTAWNARKMAISSSHDSSLLVNELRLSSLILSYSPKSENSWSHRRWVIRRIERMSGNLSEIIKQETELVERIAEKTKMNYRTWNHRCWLVSYMTRSQMLNELGVSRKWAELNVADNCCFHLRRILILKLVENISEKEYRDEGLLAPSDIYSIWEEEVEWDYLLIQRYVGREALWVHRRFLSLLSLTHFSSYPRLTFDASHFLQKEMDLILSCMKLPYDEFDDIRRQSELAVSYFFWVVKVSFGPFGEIWKKLRGIKELKDLLTASYSQEKITLWRDFLGRKDFGELFS